MVAFPRNCHRPQNASDSMCAGESQPKNRPATSNRAPVRITTKSPHCACVRAMRVQYYKAASHRSACSGNSGVQSVRPYSVVRARRMHMCTSHAVHWDDDAAAGESNMCSLGSGMRGPEKSDFETNGRACVCVVLCREKVRYERRSFSGLSGPHHTHTCVCSPACPEMR